MADSHSSFMTFEGRKVHVIHDNIANHFVTGDCFVNPCIFREHEGICGNGYVTKLLRAHGGPSYEHACRTAKPDTTTKCIVTTSGHFQCKVLHCTWEINSETLKENAEDYVFQAFRDCLQTAEDTKVEEIVFPFMFTGAFYLCKQVDNILIKLIFFVGL